MCSDLPGALNVTVAQNAPSGICEKSIAVCPEDEDDVELLPLLLVPLCSFKATTSNHTRSALVSHVTLAETKHELFFRFVRSSSADDAADVHHEPLGVPVDASLLTAVPLLTLARVSGKPLFPQALQFDSSARVLWFSDYYGDSIRRLQLPDAPSAPLEELAPLLIDGCNPSALVLIPDGTVFTAYRTEPRWSIGHFALVADGELRLKTSWFLPEDRISSASLFTVSLAVDTAREFVFVLYPANVRVIQSYCFDGKLRQEWSVGQSDEDGVFHAQRIALLHSCGLVVVSLLDPRGHEVPRLELYRVMDGSFVSWFPCEECVVPCDIAVDGDEYIHLLDEQMGCIHVYR